MPHHDVIICVYMVGLHVQELVPLKMCQVAEDTVPRLSLLAQKPLMNLLNFHRDQQVGQLNPTHLEGQRPTPLHTTLQPLTLLQAIESCRQCGHKYCGTVFHLSLRQHCLFNTELRNRRNVPGSFE